MKDAKYREIFEGVYGRRISDATWYRIKKNFDDTFPLTEKNVIWIANLKKHVPHLNFRFNGIVSKVKESRRFLENKSVWTGSEILDLFKNYKISIHANTLTKWFRPLHGFSRKKAYKANDLVPVILSAFLYKARRESSLTILDTLPKAS